MPPALLQFADFCKITSVFAFTFTFNHLADAFIQSDVQMRRTIEAIRPSREQQYTSAMTSLSLSSTVHVARIVFFLNRIDKC